MIKSYILLGRVLNRFSKDVGLIDELLPFTAFDFLQVSVIVSNNWLILLISNYVNDFVRIGADSFRYTLEKNFIVLGANKEIKNIFLHFLKTRQENKCMYPFYFISNQNVFLSLDKRNKFKIGATFHSCSSRISDTIRLPKILKNVGDTTHLRRYTTVVLNHSPYCQSPEVSFGLVVELLNGVT